MPLIDYSYPNDSYKQGSVTPKQDFGKPCFDLYVEEDDTDSRSAGDSTGEANVCSAGRTLEHPTECGRDAGSKSPVSDLEVISPPEDSILDVNGLIESIKTEIVGTVKAELAALQEVFSGISSAIVNMQGELSMIIKEQADLAHTHTPISTVQSDSRISALENKCKEQEARLKSVEHMQHMYTEPTPLKKAGDTVSKPGARGLQMQQANQRRLESVEHVQHTAPTPFKKAGDTVSKPGAHGLQMQQANHMDTTTSCSTCRSTTQQRVWASVLNSSSDNQGVVQYREVTRPHIQAGELCLRSLFCGALCPGKRHEISYFARCVPGNVTKYRTSRTIYRSIS